MLEDSLGRKGWPWTADPVSEDGPVTFSISVIVPTLNQGRFLEDALRSILLQGSTALDLIIVDGGSTDGTLEIIQRYEEFISHWVSEPDDGQTSAINKGLSWATGEWVAWLNSDDVFLPNAFRSVADAVSENPHAEWIVGSSKYLSESLEELGSFDPVVGTLSDDRLPHWLDFACSKRTGTALPQPSSFWTRRLQNEVGPLDESMSLAMDHELWVRFARHGYQPVLSSVPFAGFRIHDQQKTAGGLVAFWREEKRLVGNLVLETRGAQRSVLEAYERELKFRIRWSVMKRKIERAMSFPGGRSIYSFLLGAQRRIRKHQLVQPLVRLLRNRMFWRDR